MNVFDEHCKIKTIKTPEEIIYRFYLVRKKHFIKRKKHIISKLKSELSLIESKVKFIKYVIDEKIIIFNKKKDFIVSEIEKVGDLVQINNSWDYLLEMKIWTFTKEKIDNLKEKLKNLNDSLNDINNKKIEQIWEEELENIHG